MARVAVALVMLMTTASTAHAADDPVDEVTAVAIEAGKDPEDLRGAVNTTQMDPRSYLCMADHLLCPKSLLPVVSARVKCIEGKESGGANIWNSRGSGAGGVMQYMAGTFTAHAAEMGHPEYSRWVPWQAEAVAQWDLDHGRRAQWTVGGC